MRRAAGRVAHHEHIRLHRRQIGDRIEHALAFAGGRLRDGEIDHVGRQALGGDLEGGACARRVLEENIESRLAAQQRYFFHLALRHADKGFGRVEYLPHDVGRQAIERQQMMQLAVFVELRVARIKPHGCRV